MIKLWQLCRPTSYPEYDLLPYRSYVHSRKRERWFHLWQSYMPWINRFEIKVWNFEKYMIMSWLINSMTNKSVQLFSYSILQGRHGMWRMTLILPKTTHQRYSALKAPFKISDRETPMSRLTSLPLLDIGSNLTSLKSTCRNAQTIKSVVGQ